MIETRRAGALAAWVAAATYIIGFVVLGAVLAPAGLGAEGATPLSDLAVLAENATIYQLWNFIIYVLNGLVLVVLVLALHGQLPASGALLPQAGAAFGLIWAGLVIASGMVANVGLRTALDAMGGDPEGAAALWQAVATVRNGLGGGNEIVGGAWVLLVSLAAWRAAAMGRALSIFGMVVGAAGLISVIPLISEIGGAIFGLGMIVWFGWVGVALWRHDNAGAVTAAG